MDAEMIRAILIALTVWAVGYALACWIWPWARCGGELLGLRSCDGGRFYQNPKTKKAWRHCRKCKGTGKRRRFGRTLWALFITAKREADK